MNTLRLVAGVRLRTGSYEVTFRPDLSMLCSSLRYDGEEFVAWPRTVAQYKAGGATAIPLIHPWVNRLGRWSYTAAGHTVRLARSSVPVDTNGLPIHGNLFDVTFDVLRASDTRVVARLDYGAQHTLLRSFPFPHVLTVDARLHGTRGLTIATEVAPTADTTVPISFGWHPYVRLPRDRATTGCCAGPRARTWKSTTRTIPTGARTAQPAGEAPIGTRSYDDHYALGADRRFTIGNDTRSLTLRFDGAYPFAQLFVPPRRQVVAIEPMTAEIDALGRGTAPLCPPGETFRAAFTITVSR